MLMLPFSIWLSIEVEYLAVFVIVIVIGWRRRDHLFAALKRSALMVSIVLSGFVMLGGVAWWVRGNLNDLFLTIGLGLFVVTMALAFDSR